MGYASPTGLPRSAARIPAVLAKKPGLNSETLLEFVEGTPGADGCGNFVVAVAVRLGPLPSSRRVPDLAGFSEAKNTSLDESRDRFLDEFRLNSISKI